MSAVVVKADRVRFDKQCAARAGDANQLEMEKKIAKRKQQEAQLACCGKRRVLDARRSQLASVGQFDQRAVSVLERELTRDCR